MESKLREGPFAFMDLLDATCKGGTHFRITGADIRYACFACGQTFDQTDAGHRALREHESEHGRATCANLSELDGRMLRIVTWTITRGDEHWKTQRPEIWGVDDERGVVYCLSNAYQREDVWKWRFTHGSSGARAFLNAATPNDQG